VGADICGFIGESGFQFIGMLQFNQFGIPPVGANICVELYESQAFSHRHPPVKSECVEIGSTDFPFVGKLSFTIMPCFRVVRQTFMSSHPL
jgi:hypothetical protein